MSLKIEIPWTEKWRLRKSQEQVVKMLAKLRAEEKLENDLIERGTELKEVLIKAGIHPFSRINQKLNAEHVFMFGILNGKLVRAEMGRSGYFLIRYVGKDKDAT